MVMKLDEVVPFGRSLDEYRAMFSLSDEDVKKTFLGVGDGPASFCAEMHALGHSVVSIDPLYRLSGREIREQFFRAMEDIILQVEATPRD